MRFPLYKQIDKNDCGPSCLRMVLKFYGKDTKLTVLKEFCDLKPNGVSLMDLQEASEKLGFETQGYELSIDNLRKIHMPCILHINGNHYVVLHKIRNDKYYLADPAIGRIKLNAKELLGLWLINGKELGVCLELKPTANFQKTFLGYIGKSDWKPILRYFFQYKWLIFQIILSLIFASVIQLIFPILTQAIVDIGIKSENLTFLVIVLIAQLIIVLGRSTCELLRSWLMLYISTRINISMLTDLLVKLMDLPLSFFEKKNSGELIQRMSDLKIVESFLTGTVLRAIFSIFNLFIFGIVIVHYNNLIFIVFGFFSLCNVIWNLIFLKYRRILNRKSFNASSENNKNTIELFDGMQEIKLNNFEKKKRWEWEDIQVNLFQLGVNNLAITQYQQIGSTLINEGGNILITFLSAKAVINGELTLGGMIAVQFMVGQLINPVQLFLTLIQGYQDAKISLERLDEINSLPSEKVEGKSYKLSLPDIKSFELENLCFSYSENKLEYSLKNLNLKIEENAITAIVGMSGSGKTTLLKLLLRIYEPESGDIFLGGNRLKDISIPLWRSSCGVVLQDGYIFSDTILQNIVIDIDNIDRKLLNMAVELANIRELIKTFPDGINTKIGRLGKGISQGQKQRILLARSIYKNPKFLFYDEPTNALDITNERDIMQKLIPFFKGKTVVIAAHRLNTIINADKIVVMKNGEIVEQGTHQALVDKKGEYFKLINNQINMDKI